MPSSTPQAAARETEADFLLTSCSLCISRVQSLVPHRSGVIDKLKSDNEQLKDVVREVNRLKAPSNPSD